MMVPPLRFWNHVEMMFQSRHPLRWRLVWWLRFLGLAAFVALVFQLPRSDVQLTRLDLR